MTLNVIADLLLHLCINIYLFPDSVRSGLLTGELLALRQVPGAHAAVAVCSADEGGARLAGAPARQRDRSCFGTARDIFQKVLTAHEPDV